MLLSRIPKQQDYFFTGSWWTVSLLVSQFLLKTDARYLALLLDQILPTRTVLLTFHALENQVRFRGKTRAPFRLYPSF